VPQSKLTKCPGCDLELPEGDVRAQKEHMEEHHPEIIAERLENAGFRQEGEEWIDTLSASD
jgi:hypothetical protein